MTSGGIAGPSLRIFPVFAAMGTQSTAKTIFLLGAMGGWLLVGAALMYLFPVIADTVYPTPTTHLWMTNLTQGGYRPALGGAVGAVACVVTTGATALWYRYFDGRV